MIEYICNAKEAFLSSDAAPYVFRFFYEFKVLGCFLVFWLFSANEYFKYFSRYFILFSKFPQRIASFPLTERGNVWLQMVKSLNSDNSRSGPYLKNKQ